MTASTAAGPVAAASSARTAPRFAVVGNPENRRVSLFADAVRAAGLPAPRVVAWTDVLRARGADFAADEFVRVESPGENPEVDRLLRGAAEPTRVEGSARWYTGFTAALRTLRGGIPSPTRTTWRCCSTSGRVTPCWTRPEFPSRSPRRRVRSARACGAGTT